MNKLIKLSEEHYIIVDDSEIKKGDGFIIKCTINTEFFTILFANSSKEGKINGRFKVICSTKPIEFFEGKKGEVIYHYDKIKPLSLSEVEEAIYGYSVEKMACKDTKKCGFNNTSYASHTIQSFINGFKAHQELTKDKLFTIDDMLSIWCFAWNQIEKYKNGEKHQDFNDIIQSLFPKTEWECTIDEQGKIKLL